MVFPILNEKAIINGQQVTLSKEEQTGVTNFHNSRIAFAVLPASDGSYTLAINRKDAREHRVYLEEDFGVTDEIFETLTRGYIKPGKIVFYVSSYFYPISPTLITKPLITDLLLIARDEFGPGQYAISNGVKVGQPGEEWPPMKTLGTITVHAPTN